MTFKMHPKFRTLTDTFVETLPEGPLLQHIHAIHQMVVYLGSTGIEREVVEHSLKMIALHSRTPPHGPYGPPPPEPTTIVINKENETP